MVLWGLPVTEAGRESVGDGADAEFAQDLGQVAVELTSPFGSRLRLVHKLQAVAESIRVERILARWMNIHRREHDVDEQLIEIRIALESLYAAGGRHETSLRIPYHGA